MWRENLFIPNYYLFSFVDKYSKISLYFTIYTIKLVSNCCLTYNITSMLLVGFKIVSRGVAVEEPGGLDCSEKTAKVADNRQDNGQVRGRSCWYSGVTS